MRRRHLLALVILALVVATLAAYEPARVWVWDALTLRTVEERWPDGTPRQRYRIRYWDDEDPRDYVGTLRMWYENGQPSLQEARVREGRVVREWSEDGRLVSCMLVRNKKFHTGVIQTEDLGTGCQSEDRYANGSLIETRTSPPWFTEEEILQFVEAVEE